MFLRQVRGVKKLTRARGCRIAENIAAVAKSIEEKAGLFIIVVLCD